MKIINLNESQYGKLIESVTDADFGSSTVPEYDALDRIEVQPTITDRNGRPKKGQPVTSDDFADAQTHQQWGSVGGRRSSNTV